MNVSHHLCGQAGGSMVLAEVDTATFVGLWGDECLMVLAVCISLHFLKKNTVAIMSNMYAHV